MTKKQSRKYWILNFVPITALLVTLLYGFTCNQTTPIDFPIVIPEFVEPETIAVAEIPPVNNSQVKDSTVFDAVEQMPKFLEGSVQKWISQNVKYPAEAIEKKIEGKVYVQFIVEKDGSIGDVKIVRGANQLLENEALRVIKSMPKWRPGTQKGKNVRVSYTLPVNFSLGK